MSTTTKPVSRLLNAYEKQLRLQRRSRVVVPFQNQVYLALGAQLKRGLDMAGAATALLALSPLFALTALLIKSEDGGPVYFAQDRVGQDGQIFRFYKFRSMVLNAEALKDSLADLNESQDGVIFKSRRDPRITRIGRVIRRYSIDELPQLWNVLKGDMSLVGPRPPVPREVADYTPEDRKRLDVRPGLTCIWQVSGRSEIPFRQQVQMDQAYILNRSLKLDFLLLLKTVKAVLGGRGAY
ncbi:MAG: sugar transferase [Candidatus Sericytochromatia bacterium]